MSAILVAQTFGSGKGQTVVFRCIGDLIPDATINLGRNGGCPTPLRSLWDHDHHAPGFSSHKELTDYIRRVRRDVHDAFAAGAPQTTTDYEVLGVWK